MTLAELRPVAEKSIHSHSVGTTACDTGRLYMGMFVYVWLIKDPWEWLSWRQWVQPRLLPQPGETYIEVLLYVQVLINIGRI